MDKVDWDKPIEMLSEKCEMHDVAVVIPDAVWVVTWGTWVRYVPPERKASLVDAYGRAVPEYGDLSGSVSSRPLLRNIPDTEKKEEPESELDELKKRVVALELIGMAGRQPESELDLLAEMKKFQMEFKAKLVLLHDKSYFTHLKDKVEP